MKMDFQETVLSNGLRVVSARMPSVESLAAGIWVGVGGRYEARSVSGISHFIEHLLFKGTRKRTARDISQAIEGKGGYFNAFTQEESTCYYARIAADYGADALDVLADMYRNPLFSKTDIEKERGVIIEEIMMYRDQPHHLVQDALGELLWARHALGRPLIGTPRIIQNMTREEIIRYKKLKYLPENTVVSFAGKLNHDVCVRQVKRLLSGMRPGRATSCAKVTSKTAQESECILPRRVEQAHLALGLRVFGRHDPRRYALKLLSVILGENMSSRLFQVVRERHGLAYSIHSSVHLFQDTGALVISAGLDRRRLLKALDLVAGQFRRLRDKQVGSRELRRAKDYAIGQMRIGMESTITQMIWLGENMIGYDAFTQPEEVIGKLERVTPEDIQRLAGQVLQRRRMSLALVVPEDMQGLESKAAERFKGL